MNNPESQLAEVAFSLLRLVDNDALVDIVHILVENIFDGVCADDGKIADEVATALCELYADGDDKQAKMNGDEGVCLRRVIGRLSDIASSRIYFRILPVILRSFVQHYQGGEYSGRVAQAIAEAIRASDPDCRQITYMIGFDPATGEYPASCGFEVAAKAFLDNADDEEPADPSA